MKFAAAADFRAALEARLNLAAAGKGAPSLMRLRKLVVFDRLMARLLVVAPDRWIVKGGVALDLRLGDRARTTKDLDLASDDGMERANADLIDVQHADPGDFFAFAIERRADPRPNDDGAAVRYRVRAELAGRRFDEAVLDIGFGDALPAVPDRLLGPDLLTFAGLPRIEVAALPLDVHLAEKLHAYTRTYVGERESTRVKDLVDINLIRTAACFDADRLAQAIRDTFDRRGTHPLPCALPAPPQAWTVPYRTLARGLDLDPAIEVGYRLAAAFLDPVISHAATVTESRHPRDGLWDGDEVTRCGG